MTVSRALHTATLLPDGKVLIAGGRVHGHQDYQGTVTASAELYDPSSGTFSATGSMTAPRVWHTATLLPSGKVLMVGRDSGSGDDRTAELYDPSTGTFSRTGDTLSAQYGATATLLNNGKVLIAGGHTPGFHTGPRPVSNPELYDPLTGTFALTGTFVGPGDGYLTGGPNSPAVVLLRDGRVLFAAEPFSEVYDPVSGTFSATGVMTTWCGRFFQPSYISGRTATVLGSGEILLTGGGNEDCGRFADAERYDPATGTFTLLRPMTRRRTLHTATSLPDGTVLLAGGESESGFSLITEATAEVYDPSTANFFIVGSMQEGREGHTATLLQNGRVLLAGGLFYQDVGILLGSLNSADLYTPARLAAPVQVFPLEGVVTDDLRPRLQVHNVVRTRPAGVVTYRFEWSDRSDFQPGPQTAFKDGVPESEGGDTVFVIADDLLPDAVYYWRARATINAPAGQTDVSGEYSERRSFRTPDLGGIRGREMSSMSPASGMRATASRPGSAVVGPSGLAAAPSRLVATASGSGVVLTWIAPFGVMPVRYAISGGMAPHASTLPVVVTPDASTHYAIPALSPGPYYFRVFAILADGLSPASDEAVAVTSGSASASRPPSGALALVDGAYVTATWTPSLVVGTLYRVEIGRGPGQADVAVLTTTQPSATYRAETATHYLRVRAVHGARVSAPSNEVSVSVVSALCAAAPRGPILLPASTTDGQTTLSWLPALGSVADHYRIDGTGPTGPLKITSLGPGTSLTAILKPGVYAIGVSAVNTCGVSVPSNQIMFTADFPGLR